MSGPLASPPPFSDAEVRGYLGLRADAVAAGSLGPQRAADRLGERLGMTRRRKAGGRAVRLIVVLGLLAALLLAGLYLVGRQQERYTPSEPRVTAALRGSPWAMAMADGSIWVGAYREPVLFRLDPATARPVGEVRLRGFVCGQLEPALGYLWFSECGLSSLARLDPRSLEVVRLAGYGSDRVAFDDAGIWAPTASGLERLDPETLTVTRRLDVDAGGLLAAGFGSIWVSDADGGRVVRVDPDLGAAQVVGWPGRGGRPYPVHIAVGGGGVWVIDERLPALFRIDPATNTAVEVPVSLERIDGTGFGDHVVVASGDEIWVRQSARAVARVDPRTLGLIERIETPSTGGGAFAVTPGAIWIANMKEQTVTGIDRP